MRMLKLRSMVDGADTMLIDLAHCNESDGLLFKIANDPRVTRTPTWWRSTSRTCGSARWRRICASSSARCLPCSAARAPGSSPAFGRCLRL